MQVFGLYLKDETTLYSDLYFKRQTYRCDTPECSVVIDTHIQSQISFCYFSFPEFVTNISFSFQEVENIPLKEGTVYMSHLRGELSWMPVEPVVRSYGMNNNVISELPCAAVFNNQGTAWRLNLTHPKDCPGRMEYTVVLCRGDLQDMLRQIQNTERRGTDGRIRVADYFDTSRWGYFWKNMICGHVYRVGQKHDRFIRCICEQNALYLYLWLWNLEKYTGKWIYSVLAEYIAYSVLVRLTEDGRWRYGLWTEINETHARMQLGGIQILCHFYRKQARDIFRDKAIQAMDYLIKMAIPLSKGIWFLHDDLEINEERRALYYRQFIKSEAFGKTVSCTLCLNTHIYTMVVMDMMCRIIPQDKYKSLIQQGMESLLDVLSSRPMGLLYGVVYRVRDLLLKFQDNFAMSKMLWKYNLVLSNKIVPFLKCRFPRLIMPNGFVERDLCVLHVSDGYHIVNLLDLLMFYSAYPVTDLRQTIIQVMKYTFSDGFLKLAFKSTSIAVSFLSEILWLFSCQIDSTWLVKMPELLSQFRLKGIRLGPLVQSSPLMSDENLVLKPDNQRLVCLSSVKQDKYIAAIFNPEDSSQRTKVVCLGQDMSDDLSWLSNNNQTTSLHEELTLLPKGYAVLIKRGNDINLSINTLNKAF
jgi:hypothetical protein